LGLQEPETIDLSPDALLADEGEEHEEASQHIAAINNSEEHLNKFDTTAGSSIVVVGDKVETFYAQRDTKNQKGFKVENLKIF
jgi:hypothetical protein